MRPLRPLLQRRDASIDLTRRWTESGSVRNPRRRARPLLDRKRYATTYLTTGRNLLRMHSAPVSKEKPVIVADPLFGEPDASVTRRASGLRTFHSVTDGPDGSTSTSLRCSEARSKRARSSRCSDAALLTGRRATKAALERMASRQHPPHRLARVLPGRHVQRSAELVLARNPLLRSGLALAGANLPGGARGDGILTALEASSLNLEGTGLVTLSACDTRDWRCAKRRRRVRFAPRLHACRREDARHEPLAGHRRSRSRHHGRLLRAAACRLRPRRCASADEAGDAPSIVHATSLLLGRIHSIR